MTPMYASCLGSGDIFKERSLPVIASRERMRLSRNRALGSGRLMHYVEEIKSISASSRAEKDSTTLVGRLDGCNDRAWGRQVVR